MGTLVGLRVPLLRLLVEFRLILLLLLFLGFNGYDETGDRQFANRRCSEAAFAAENGDAGGQDGRRDGNQGL